MVLNHAKLALFTGLALIADAKRGKYGYRRIVEGTDEIVNDWDAEIVVDSWNAQEDSTRPDIEIHDMRKRMGPVPKPYVGGKGYEPQGGGYGYGGCEIRSYQAVDADKKDRIIYEVASSMSQYNDSFGVSDSNAFGFRPYYDQPPSRRLETDDILKFGDKQLKAVSVSVPSEMFHKNMVQELTARLGDTVKSWGYTIPTPDGSTTRVVVVFKPYKNKNYAEVFSYAGGESVELWKVEKFSDYGIGTYKLVKPLWGTDYWNLGKPFWVLAKWNSKATSSNCVSSFTVPIERQEEDDAKDEEDIKETKMYKKYSEMTKKKLMKLMKKYQEKIVIAKKALKAKKKDKEN